MKHQKSKLIFVPDHHNFDDGEIECTTEMLSWPFINSKGENWPNDIKKVYIDAFTALTQIGPFYSKVSMIVDVKKKKFISTRRVWVNIYLGGDFILSISHDTRLDNAAFICLTSWPELFNYPNWPNYEGKEKEEAKIYAWSSIDNWKLFFEERISKIAKAKLNDAKLLKKQAKEYIDEGQEILSALSH